MKFQKISKGRKYSWKFNTKLETSSFSEMILIRPGLCHNCLCGSFPMEKHFYRTRFMSQLFWFKCFRKLLLLEEIRFTSQLFWSNCFRKISHSDQTRFTSQLFWCNRMSDVYFLNDLSLFPSVFRRNSGRSIWAVCLCRNSFRHASESVLGSRSWRYLARWHASRHRLFVCFRPQWPPKIDAGTIEANRSVLIE